MQLTDTTSMAGNIIQRPHIVMCGRLGQLGATYYDLPRMKVTNSRVRSTASTFHPAFSHACAWTRARLKVLPHQVRSDRALAGKRAPRTASSHWNDICPPKRASNSRYA
ncbi:hypothetical protein [Micromonospora fulviviridis]|uniref:hypothetical protein n=1 Tax=Micromonospora fulviviridis TaxID=47860 RepID=UPI0037889ED6